LVLLDDDVQDKPLFIKDLVTFPATQDGFLYMCAFANRADGFLPYSRLPLNVQRKMDDIKVGGLPTFKRYLKAAERRTGQF
jgi:hypothetical protein